MSNNQKKIYITGVSGFIGSNLAKKLKELNYDVIGIIHSSNPLIEKELGIKVIENDLLKNNILKLDNAYAVIHCATANDILSKNTYSGLSLSILGTNKLLESLKETEIKKLIFFSTAQVYGTELLGSLDENTPVNCETFYGLNHYLGEELCKSYSLKFNLDITVLRPTNVYGFYQASSVNRRTLVPVCFIDEALQQGSITLRSSGKQTRNFISNDELAEIALNTLEDFPKGFSIRNCGSNWYSSILEIAELVSESYEKFFKKKLVINIESELPKSGNIFQYKSNFVKFRQEMTSSKINMKNVINKFFELSLKKL
tara:strand:+ start:1919 stop:2860 length:942 start_codon:yes stop_codon:yes gene_type:complete